MSDMFEHYLRAFADAGCQCEWKTTGDGFPTITVSHPSKKVIARFSTRNQKWRVKRGVNGKTKESGVGLSKLIDGIFLS